MSQGHSKGNVSELENAVLSSSRKEVGSEEMPDIFSSYADTAFELEKEGLLSDILWPPILRKRSRTATWIPT